MGSPFAMQPPSVLTGSRPPISVSPAATMASCSPCSQKPHSARCMISAPLSVSCSCATSTSAGRDPGGRERRGGRVGADAGRHAGALDRRAEDLEGAEAPGAGRPHRAAGRRRPRRAATASLVTMIAAPPSPGEQNMKRVSGSLTMSAAAISSAEIGSRRQALGLQRTVAIGLLGHQRERPLADAVLAHVAGDLDAEELRGHHEARLAVRRREGPSPPGAGRTHHADACRSRRRARSRRLPERIAFTADISALPPVAQPFLTFVNGMPVRPRSATRVSARPEPSLPPNATWTSVQASPASTQRRVDRVERELAAGAAGLPAELRQSGSDDRDSGAHWPPCLRSARTSASSVANRGTGSAATSVTWASPSSSAKSVQSRTASTLTPSGSST